MSANTSTPAVQGKVNILAKQLANNRERILQLKVDRYARIAKTAISPLVPSVVTAARNEERLLRTDCSPRENTGAFALDVALGTDTSKTGFGFYRVQNPYGWHATTWIFVKGDKYEFLKRFFKNNSVNLDERIGFRVAKNQEGNGRNTSRVATGIDNKMEAKGKPPNGYVRVVVILVSKEAPWIYGKKLIKIDFEVSLGEAYTFGEKIEIHNSKLMEAKALAINGIVFEDVSLRNHAMKADMSKVKAAQKELAETLAAQQVLAETLAAQKAREPQVAGHVASVKPSRVKFSPTVTVFEISDDEFDEPY